MTLHLSSVRDIFEEHNDLLSLLSGNDVITSENFKKLLVAISDYAIIAKVFLLDGKPFVFKDNPMRYLIFREQVAERFAVGSQDVCIVGSAKLGFSPSEHKYGREFQKSSDVDVVIVSPYWVTKGCKALFAELTSLVKIERKDIVSNCNIQVCAKSLARMQDSIRNFVYNNFNPSLLSDGCALKAEIFDKISSTSGLFLALEPKVFVSKIRCRFFESWKAAEDYYSHSLRALALSFKDSKDEHPNTSLSGSGASDDLCHDLDIEEASIIEDQDPMELSHEKSSS